ncbi:MAG: hypothetical protein L0Z70_05030 [Chloroflexi bacterium]|nr:hypothetical protein [Chloroflexota bacterium]
MITQQKRPWQRIGRIWMVGFALVTSALACRLGEPETPWTPENPREYTAEVRPATEVYVVLDEAGAVVDFDGPYAYAGNAQMRYVLRFWDVGALRDGYGAATISRVYTPLQITGINDDLEETLSEEQKTNIYARVSFPATEVKLHDLNFSGGPEGYFLGTNSETGEEIWGYMDWREKEWEMHIVFTRDIKQDYVVIDDEPFYNWP